MWKSLINHYFQDNGTNDLDKSKLKKKKQLKVSFYNGKHTCKFQYQKLTGRNT